jgi:membrane protease subunit HflC
MSNRLTAVLVGLAVLLFFGYSSIFVVNERQQAIVVRFGQIQDVKTAPGLYFKLPFAFMDADRVQYVENRALRFDHDNIRVQVSGGKFYEVDAFVVYRITDARRFRQTVSGVQLSAE